MAFSSEGYGGNYAAASGSSLLLSTASWAMTADETIIAVVCWEGSSDDTVSIKRMNGGAEIANFTMLSPNHDYMNVRMAVGWLQRSPSDDALGNCYAYWGSSQINRSGLFWRFKSDQWSNGSIVVMRGPVWASDSNATATTLSHSSLTDGEVVIAFTRFLHHSGITLSTPSLDGATPDNWSFMGPGKDKLASMFYTIFASATAGIIGVQPSNDFSGKWIAPILGFYEFTPIDAYFHGTSRASRLMNGISPSDRYLVGKSLENP